MSIAYTVFSKPWKGPLAEMAQTVSKMGFEGVELPVRPGFQVEPANIARDLPEAAGVLADHGLKIGSVAGPTDEPTIAACASAGVPLIRICCHIPEGGNRLEWEASQQEEFDAIAPALEVAGVAVGVQNHCDRGISSTAGVMRLVGRFDPRLIGIVLDFGHCGLAGEPAGIAIDTAWSHLLLVNFKNAFWRLTSGPEAEQARFQHYWTSARRGMADWTVAAGELKKRNYSGDVCLTAEYSDATAVQRLAAEDLAYLKSLFEN